MSMTKRTIEMTTEQMQAILKGAPSGAEFGIKRPDYDFAYYKQGQENYAMYRAPSGYWFESVLSNEYLLENAEVIKLSDIRAELDSRQSIQAYFASDERGSIEQEQSVIERVKLLKKFVDDLDSNDTIQSSLLSSVDWKINKLFPELKEVAGDE